MEMKFRKDNNKYNAIIRVVSFEAQKKSKNFYFEKQKIKLKKNLFIDIIWTVKLF